MLKRAYLEITNVCNLHCAFCPGTRRTAQFISEAQFAQAAQKLRPYTQYLYLHVMGEPLLHPALPRLLDIAGALDFRVLVTTNGTLLATHGESLLHASVHKIAVSLHSFEGNAQGDLLDYLGGVFDFADRASRAGKLVALRLWNEGGANTRNAEICAFLSDKLGTDVDALPQDARKNRKLRQRLYLESDVKFDWPAPDAAERAVRYCHALRQQIAVLCDGTVVPCCLDCDGAMPLGNLFTQSMEEILQSPRAADILRGFARRSPTEELCRRCGYATRFTR